MKIIQSILSLVLLLLHVLGNAQNPDDWKLPEVTAPVFKKDTFNIVKYGAVSDGFTLNTKSISAAIAECNSSGGGIVLIPEGVWLSGPIELKSNIDLHLSENSILIFTKDKSQYPLIESNWEGSSAARNQSPLSANNAENIAITGNGIVDGNGDSWRAVKKDKLTETQWKRLISGGGLVSEDGKTWYPSEQYLKGSKLDKPGVLTDGKTINDYLDYKDFFRPNLLVFTNCNKILLEGVTFQNSAAWGLHSFMCKNLTVRNVYVKNPWYAQNGDGIDVESCTNVLIENSTFDVGDDGICIKSGRDEEGRKRGMPTENLIARNCVVYHAHGGFVIGSEMSGGVKNMFVENCSFIGTDIGLRFKTKRGRGGVVEDVYIRNINMKDIIGEAILFDMYYMAKDPILLAGEKREAPKVETFPVNEGTPKFKNFYIDKVVCAGANKSVFIRGLPEMNIENINLSNITILANEGIEISEAKNINFKNVNIITEKSGPVITINNSSKVTLDKVSYDNDIPLILSLIGDKTKEIIITNPNASISGSQLKFSEGAEEKAVHIEDKKNKKRNGRL